MNAKEVKRFTGRQVLIRTADGHDTHAFLQDVGHQGVTLLVKGQRVYGPLLDDIVFIGAKGDET